MAIEKTLEILLQKRRVSIRRKFIVFSIILFIIILSACSISFYVLMGKFIANNSGRELSRLVEVERLRLENFIRGEIILANKMASSPFLKRYFENPENLYLESLAFEELNTYREAFEIKTIYFINDKDKRFYYDNEFLGIINPNESDNYWYNLTLYETQHYNVNINFNPLLNTTKLWVNAPVFNDSGNPIAILGAGIELENFINSVYEDYSDTARLYFFNADGEITGAQDKGLAANKIKIYKHLDIKGIELFEKALTLSDDEIVFFRNSNRTISVAVGKVPPLNWYVAAVLPLRASDVFSTQIAVLFIAMMLVIAFVFVIFNLFAMDLLSPLSSLIKKMNKISADIDIINQHDDIEVMGKFFNMAITDPLTGVFNRRYMEGNLKKLIKSLSRTHEQLSILMIDIDFFKKYNDSYGHDKGDECLKKVANILSQCVRREGDFIARYGGEEFVAVLPNTNKEGAGLVALSIMDKIRSSNIPHKNSDIADHVTVSIGGTSVSVNHAHNVSDYIKLADKALYKSKHSGRNQYMHETFA